MRFKLRGRFLADTIKEFPGKKDPAKTFKGGDAIFNVTYEHTDPQTEEVYSTSYAVPFKVFGQKQCDVVQSLKLDEEADIFFEVAGREYQGKYYAENKVFVIKTFSQTGGAPPRKPASTEDDDIPFPTS